MSPAVVDRLALRVPSDLRYGEAVRALVAAVCERLEQETSTPNLRSHVVSAFGEAFNNVVDHAHRGVRSEAVEVDVAIGSTGIELRVSDRGRGFELEAVGTPDLAQLPEGGLGLLIIRSFMTRVEYEAGDPNRLVMIKEFAHPWSGSAGTVEQGEEK